MNHNILKSYQSERSKGWTAQSALRNARTLEAWRNLNGEVAGEYDSVSDQCDVRLLIMGDVETYDDSYIDTWDISDAEKEKTRAELRERIEHDGVWGIVGQYRTCACDYCDNPGHWEDVDSVWGFVGDDWKDSGYDTDVMQATMDAFKDYLATIHERGMSRECEHKKSYYAGNGAIT